YVHEGIRPVYCNAQCATLRLECGRQFFRDLGREGKRSVPGATAGGRGVRRSVLTHTSLDSDGVGLGVRPGQHVEEAPPSRGYPSRGGDQCRRTLSIKQEELIPHRSTADRPHGPCL